MKDDFECSVERNNISLFIIDVLIRGLMVDIFSHYRNNHLIFFTHSSALWSCIHFLPQQSYGGSATPIDIQPTN